MSNTEGVVTICDWCLQEVRVQTIDEKLWRFWKIISVEDPIVTSHRNICDKCRVRSDLRWHPFFVEIFRKWPKRGPKRVGDSFRRGKWVFFEKKNINLNRGNGGCASLIMQYSIFCGECAAFRRNSKWYKGICHRKSLRDKSHYEGFSIYIERCKINASKVDELLSTGHVKGEPPIDIEYPPLIKTDIVTEVDSISFRPAVSSGVFIEQQTLVCCSNSSMKSEDSMIDKVLSAGKVKKEPVIDTEDRLMNKEGVWKKEEASDPDYPTASHVVLEHQVLPGSMVHQKKVNNCMCTYCDEILNSPYKLKVHLRIHTGEKPLKCSHCSKSFTALSSLNRHLRTHTGEKPFKCSHCEKSFTTLSSLSVHLRTHTGEKPFKCSDCNKSFTSLSNFNVHLRTHTGEKPFKCSYCNKSFTSWSNLNRHLRTHTGEKPFKCSRCIKNFTTSSDLNVHLRVHTGEKPFKCSYCDKSFAGSSHFNVHLRIHTGEKPCKCSHCSKSFTTLSSLNRHLRTHTGEKPFKCSHCNKSFAHSNCLKRHSGIHTNDK